MIFFLIEPSLKFMFINFKKIEFLAKDTRLQIF